MRPLKVIGSTAAAGGSGLAALWTFPGMVLSAFLVSWGAEAAQFLISQGLALAILAWLQTLPEFAVEAVIAWDAGRDPARAHLAIANLTGAIRLLIGLGWPMIYFVAAFFRRNGTGPALAPVRLAPEHAVEIVGLVPALLYFLVILAKATIGWMDAVVLVALYLGYLWVLSHHPPHEAEEVAGAPAVSRWAYRQRGWRRPAAIAGLFAAGGALLYVTTEPFLESMLAVAGTLGVSQFVFVQWVAPFLSEFPEKLSAFNWARRVSHAPLALMNLVSSNINQWTVLAAMIPLVYGYSHWHHHGVFAAFVFDPEQQLEILITLLQSLLGVVLLLELEFDWGDAAALFVLWAVQFGVPSLREAVAIAYGAWIVLLLALYATGRRKATAVGHFIATVMMRGGGPPRAGRAP